jgi:hypothetical protein
MKATGNQSIGLITDLVERIDGAEGKKPRPRIGHLLFLTFPSRATMRTQPAMGAA